MGMDLSGMRGELPDLNDGCRVIACTGMGKAVEVFNRAQDIVVGDSLLLAAGLDHRPDEERTIRLFSFLLSSSQVTTTRLLCSCAH